MRTHIHKLLAGTALALAFWCLTAPGDAQDKDFISIGMMGDSSVRHRGERFAPGRRQADRKRAPVAVRGLADHQPFVGELIDDARDVAARDHHAPRDLVHA